jgi:N-acetylglucosaminyldiphosphoundecaprenol N-acetyl-beta-D-mannosaminyltransferase
MTLGDLLDLFRERVNAGQQCLTAYQNMHGLHVRLHDAALERLHRLPRTFVHIDGMPLVFLCRLAGIRASRDHRVTLVDFIWPLLELAAREKWRVFYLGGTEEVLANGLAAIVDRIPALEILGHSGYFDTSDSAANRHVLDEIAAFRPHLVLVGMGMGRQERWILDNFAELAPASVYAVGACMEYLAGAVKVPPRWMGRAGLEWLFRLAGDPKRFWFRYMLEPWSVVAYVARYMSRRPAPELPLTIDSSILGPVTATQPADAVLMSELPR